MSKEKFDYVLHQDIELPDNPEIKKHLQECLDEQKALAENQLSWYRVVMLRLLIKKGKLSFSKLKKKMKEKLGDEFGILTFKVAYSMTFANAHPEKYEICELPQSERCKLEP
ncbi:hypothetical protein ACFL29_01090 [Patescibacteria group bacterium]